MTMWEPFIGNKDVVFKPLYGKSEKDVLPVEEAPPKVSPPAPPPAPTPIVAPAAVKPMEAKGNLLGLAGLAGEDKKKWLVLVVLLLVICLALYIIKLRKAKPKKKLSMDNIEAGYKALKAMKARKK